MLKEQLIESEIQNKSKPRKYVTPLIAIASICLMFLFYLAYRHRYDENSPIQMKNSTLVNFQRNIKQKVYPCPLRHKIFYIWTFGEMPDVYKDFVERCHKNILILNETHFEKYLKMWNEKYPEYAIKNVDKLPFNTKNDFLKRLYLYFEGGIYADFDTEINEQCWEDFESQKIIYTNTWGAYESFSLPEQNFMKVPKPFNKDLKQYIIEMSYEVRSMGNRWDRCRREQCVILFCQNHNYDNSWVGLEKKGDRLLTTQTDND